MNRWEQILTLVISGLIFFVTPTMAETMTIVTPYYGMETNTYSDSTYGLDLEDSEPIKGIYLQSVNPEKYQWNLFVYQTGDINYSDLWGFNFTYDYYFGARDNIKNVIGVGMNYLDMDLAGKAVPTRRGPLDELTIDMSVSSYYLRVGRYYAFGDDRCQYTLLPWVGGELDQTRGDGLADFPGPRSASFNVDDNQTSLIAGLNFKFTFHHFLQAEVKHSVVYNDDNIYQRSSAMVNLFMTKNLGLSYRYNRQETPMGEDAYSMFGIAMVF